MPCIGLEGSIGGMYSFFINDLTIFTTMFAYTYNLLRKTLILLISKSKISVRRFRNFYIFFKSTQHLNLFFYQAYERAIWNRLFKVLPTPPPQSLVLDIGANIGQSSLILHSLYSDIKTIAYEPSPNEFIFLEANILVNRINTIPINSFVANSEAEIKFQIDTLTGGRTSAIDLTNNCQSIVIETLSLKKEIEKYSPFLVKIDIEGYELDLFQNSNLSHYSKVNFFIEVRETTSEKIIGIFLNTHKVFYLEKNIFIHSPIIIKFGNLLLLAKL